MAPQEANRLSAEHSMLCAGQYEALQKAPCLLMSRAEREAYDRRRVRIEEISELLRKFSLDNDSDGSHPSTTQSQENAT